MGLRIAIYIRVSTLDQAREGYSLAAQRKSLVAWAEDHGHTVSRVYEDAGISAKDINHRPDMLHMLADADAGQFDLILVWALSRLTRSVADLYNTWERVSMRGIDLKSYTEPFDTSTVIGRAMMGILGVFAQMERELTAERVKAAMSERAAQGKRTCNEVLGYDLDGPDNLKINEAEAERVRYIFDRYLEYRNLSAVAELCRLKGFPGKRGKPITADGIRKILTRSVYAGYNSFCGQLFRGSFEPIISETQFNRVQRILGRPNKVGRKRSRPLSCPVPVK